MRFSGAFAYRPKMASALRGYSASKFKDDLIAGIVVGIVALPLAIAFGIASGAVSYTHLTLPTTSRV